MKQLKITQSRLRQIIKEELLVKRLTEGLEDADAVDQRAIAQERGKAAIDISKTALDMFVAIFDFENSVDEFYEKATPDMVNALPELRAAKEKLASLKTSLQTMQYNPGDYIPRMQTPQEEVPTGELQQSDQQKRIPIRTAIASKE
jgi:GTP1/Obg family GTP-binding protein